MAREWFTRYAQPATMILTTSPRTPVTPPPPEALLFMWVASSQIVGPILLRFFSRLLMTPCGIEHQYRSYLE